MDKAGSVSSEGPNPSGLCLCGCGQETWVATKSNTRRGLVQGKPARYIRGHNGKSYPPGRAGMKRCCTCGEEKSGFEFGAHYKTADGLKARCKDCTRRAVNDWKDRNPEKARAQWRRAGLARSFGLTWEEYCAMLDRQQGLCAICRCPETSAVKGTTRLLGVDHDHRTGSIRGLLCADCNRAIGMMKDDPLRLRAAADYLSSWSR